MKRRLFLSGTAVAALGLVGCGGGGGGGGGAATDLATGVLTSAAPSAGPVSSSLPSKILACYYTAFTTGGYRISDIPAEFNVIYLFHAKPNSDGSFRFEHYDEVPAADIQACRQRGQKVILTVGGASNGFNFSNRQQSQAFVASFQDIASRLGGVDGCDFNNFEANVGSSPEEMIWISRQLKAVFGEGFAITAPPQPNSAEDRAMLKAMADAGVLSWAGPQFYDWSGFNDPGFIANRTNDWVNDLGEEKVMLGLGANYDNGPSLQDCIREWDAVKMAHPNIRGMFCWSAQHNLNGGNVWGQTMKGML